MTHTTTSTRLYDAACVAQPRFQAARLSVPDELYWFNNNTDWDALNRKEFREIMIRMETVTVQFYADFGQYVNPGLHTAIKKFWADEWGCEYVPETDEWLNLATGAIIQSETAKKAEKDEKKALRALKKASKALKKAEKKKSQSQSQSSQSQAQYNDEEEEVYVQAAQKLQQQPQQIYDYDAWYDAEEEAYAEVYAQAQAQAAQKEQAEAQAYLVEDQAAPTTRITCQAVLYIEELTETSGDPDWRAYIYYDARIRRYVVKGTRRSLRATSKKTVYPEIKLCFRSSHELASYLRSSTDSPLNLSMYAMSSATVKDATFAQLYALPAHGYKTELFGYDETCPRFSTFVNYLRILRDIDVTHSTFASF